MSASDREDRTMQFLFEAANKYALLAPAVARSMAARLRSVAAAAKVSLHSASVENLFCPRCSQVYVPGINCRVAVEPLRKRKRRKRCLLRRSSTTAPAARTLTPRRTQHAKGPSKAVPSDALVAEPSRRRGPAKPKRCMRYWCGICGHGRRLRLPPRERTKSRFRKAGSIGVGAATSSGTSATALAPALPRQPATSHQLPPVPGLVSTAQKVRAAAAEEARNAAAAAKRAKKKAQSANAKASPTLPSASAAEAAVAVAFAATANIIVTPTATITSTATETAIFKLTATPTDVSTGRAVSTAGATASETALTAKETSTAKSLETAATVATPLPDSALMTCVQLSNAAAVASTTDLPAGPDTAQMSQEGSCTTSQASAAQPVELKLRGLSGLPAQPPLKSPAIAKEKPGWLEQKASDAPAQRSFQGAERTLQSSSVGVAAKFPAPQPAVE
ncbi:unnamed protein product, partial [Polarella glacialis]